jgi:hypothetical protein
MSKIALTPSATGTGVFTISSPATNTDRTLTLPDEAGTVLTSASPVVLPKGGPAFKAISTNQSFTAQIYTKISANIKEFDITSAYDASTYKFQPTVSGYYWVSIFIQATSANATLLLTVYKNGGNYQRLQASYPAIVDSSGGSTLVHLNGSTDYLEGYGLWNANNTAYCVFEGYLVRAA